MPALATKQFLKFSARHDVRSRDGLCGFPIQPVGKKHPSTCHTIRRGGFIEAGNFSDRRLFFRAHTMDVGKNPTPRRQQRIDERESRGSPRFFGRKRLGIPFSFKPMRGLPPLVPLTLSATSHQAANFDLAGGKAHGLLWPGFNATAPPEPINGLRRLRRNHFNKLESNQLREVKEQHFEDCRH